MAVKLDQSGLQNAILSELRKINYDNGGPDLQAKATEVIAKQIAIYVDKAIQELSTKIETSFNTHTHTHPTSPTGVPLKPMKL